jgi:hypothetical protein
MTGIGNTENILDTRDIIERFEALDAENEQMTMAEDDFAEYEALKELLEDLKGNGGDEQWNGDWYPVTLIRENYFEDAMDEMLEDCGDLKPYAERPSYIQITIDYDALKMDYASADYDGVTYWYR